MTKTVYLEKSDTGATLTTWVYCGLWQLYAAEKMGHQGYLHWPQAPNRSLQPYQDPAMFKGCPNMYDWYFVQPVFRKAPPPPCDLTWLWENCPEAGQHSLMGLPLTEIKAYYRKNLIFSDSVNLRGEALVQKYNLNFSQLIGLTWRGTDCVTDGRPRLPIETYYPYLDAILAREPNLRIMATAEETGVLLPLLRRYPSAFMIQEFLSSPAGCLQNPERFTPVSGFERGLQPALMVWLFSKCKYYVKNRSSSGGVASWLSSGTIINLAHPENLGYSFDLTRVEIKGTLLDLRRPDSGQLRQLLEDA
jgi:hypothetical protein